MATTPPVFTFRVIQDGKYLLFLDNRDMALVSSSHNINPNLDIDEDRKRIVFSIPTNACHLDFRKLKTGFLIFLNPMTREKYQIQYVDSDGNNIINQVITNWIGNENVTIEDILISVLKYF